MAQQAFILWFGDAQPASNNLAALNTQLNQGWKVAKVSAMSGTGEQGNETPESKFPYSRALVILEK